MQFPEQWLRAYVNPPIGSDELAERLTMAGLEVESVEPVAPPFSGVVVARVLSVERHPNADKLTVCRVDAGTGESLNIVCGAPNVVAGMRVPCALAGAVLPGEVRIESAKMRGVESQGMLCSARELGLSDDHGGLLALPADAPIGHDLREFLALDDRKFTIKLTPNRGDCLSVVGVARETAAITGAPLALPSFAPVPATIDARLPVTVHHADLCGRFSGRVIRGVDARAATPEWMKRRLERSGQRPISALVDISNYVMLEMGRPSHVFDLDKVAGGLQVRWGRPGERVELLNGQTVEVDDWVGVIADDRGVEALAGVMGGEATAVTLDTRNIYVEAAFWWPASIQGRARRYNFSTDASHRFERGVDFATTVEHIEYITRLIVEICGTPQTKIGPVDDHVLRLPERRPVNMRVERCRRVIGVPIDDGDIAAMFRRLGLAAERTGTEFRVTPPSYRFDLEIEEDLIEEVARLWGFERIPAHPPLAPAVMRTQPETVRSAHELRRALADAGYQELVNFSFVDPAWEQDFAGNAEPIRVLNPIASHLAVMRTTLIGGLVAALKYNLNRKAARVRVFELGRVYARDTAVADGPLAVAGVRQPNRVGALAYGPAWDEQWGVAKRDVDYFDVKGDVERLLRREDARFVAAEHPALHPGRSARIELDGRSIGFIGELHPRWQQKYELPKAPIIFELDVDALVPMPLPRYREVPRFPAVLRDVALWVDASVTLQQVLDAVARIARTDERLRVLRDFRLFDLYRPGGEDSSKFAGASANALLNKEKSLAFRIVLQDTDRTLADADADAAVAAIVEGLSAQIGARLRQ
ncbi:MAG: phenylalanine--tRNA ligase subunit beta [Burkholderiaceae bacterium]